MKILVVEPEKAPYVKDISISNASMDDVVGGSHEMDFPFEDRVVVIYNENGKHLDLPFNRLSHDKDIVGTFFLCGFGDEHVESLSPQLMAKYLNDYTDFHNYLSYKDSLLRDDAHGMSADTEPQTPETGGVPRKKQRSGPIR